MNGDFKVFAKYKWLAPFLWMVLGGLGFRIALPWDGVSEVRAEVRRIDSTHLSEIHRIAASLEAHLAWADTTQRANAAKQEAAAEDIRARSRFDCMRAKRSHDVYSLDMLIASGVRCNELLGNRMPP